MAEVAFAVTTRSRLRGYRYFPLMWLSSRRIRRQLAKTPGVVRWASIRASPREFWTITVWSDRDRMTAFMGSGAHEEIMWLFGRWLQSFWLTRWRPTGEEVGAWEGQQMAPPPATTSRRTRSEQQQAALDAALAAFPRLRDSVDADGAATFDTAASTRRRQRAVEGTSAVIIRVAADRFRDGPRLRRSLRHLGRALDAHPSMLRRVVGIGSLREGYALVLLRDVAACTALLGSAELAALRAEWGAGVWAMRWDAANEFGHWDGLRLRGEGRQHHGLRMPKGAAAAAEG